MKAVMLLVSILALSDGVSRAAGTASKVTPVEKVTQLLQSMLQKGKEEKHAEQVQYASYKQFCDDTTVDKTRAIEEADELIKVLTADIGKYKAEVQKLTKEVAKLDEDISTAEADKKAATKVRKTEKADYDTTHKDYSESIDALGRAIDVMKKQSHDRSQADALVQISNLKKLRMIPEHMKKAIDYSLAQDLSSTAPEAAGYEFQSAGVIQMLEKLEDKFVDEKTKLEQAEMKSKHAYELLAKDLSMQIENSQQDRDKKVDIKAEKLEAKASAEATKDDTTKSMNADKKYLADTTATCESKASEFKSRQELRAEEIVAIEKAIEIISSGSVTGNAEKHLPQLVQEGSVLNQLRASSTTQAQQQVAQLLRQQGRQLNSRLLETAAARASADPFLKVKKLIQDLITRLEEEASSESDHKDWCDTELTTNEQTRTEKTNAVETLRADVEELEASIAKLTEEITNLNAGIAALDKAMAEMTEIRQSEKTENAEAIEDAKEAQAAVSQALAVLRDFYAKAAEATALIQRQPDIFDSPYNGMQTENGGVVGMLEVIQSDFERLEAETVAAESESSKKYADFMSDSKADKKAKNRDIEHKTAKMQDKVQAKTVKDKDLKGTEAELAAANEYWDKLKPSCVTVGTSYDDRVGRRQEELDSLQEALKILNGQ